jgi:hypothetical protein
MVMRVNSGKENDEDAMVEHNTLVTASRFKKGERFPPESAARYFPSRLRASDSSARRPSGMVRESVLGIVEKSTQRV